MMSSFQHGSDSLVFYDSTILIVLSHLEDDHARKIVDEYISPLDYFYNHTYFCTRFTTEFLP